MGRTSAAWGWAWHQERTAVLRLAAATLVLAACAPAFAVAAATGLRTVHLVSTRQVTTIALSPGTYVLDQDPDASGFAVRPADVSIAGPAGSARLHAMAYDQSPTDLGGYLLGVGGYVQAGRFKATQAGYYRVHVSGRLAGPRMFVTETFSASAKKAGSWAVAILAALSTITVTAAQLWRRRRGLVAAAASPAATAGLPAPATASSRPAPAPPAPPAEGASEA